MVNQKMIEKTLRRADPAEYHKFPHLISFEDWTPRLVRFAAHQDPRWLGHIVDGKHVGAEVYEEIACQLDEVLQRQEDNSYLLARCLYELAGRQVELPDRLIETLVALSQREDAEQWGAFWAPEVFAELAEYFSTEQLQKFWEGLEDNLEGSDNYGYIMPKVAAELGIREDVSVATLQKLLESGKPSFIDSLVAQHRKALENFQIRKQLANSSRVTVRVRLLFAQPVGAKKKYMQKLVEEHGLVPVARVLEKNHPGPGLELAGRSGGVFVALAKSSGIGGAATHSTPVGATTTTRPKGPGCPTALF